MCSCSKCNENYVDNCLVMSTESVTGYKQKHETETIHATYHNRNNFHFIHPRWCIL
jgi:hypothetical protein